MSESADEEKRPLLDPARLASQQATDEPASAPGQTTTRATNRRDDTTRQQGGGVSSLVDQDDYNDEYDDDDYDEQALAGQFDETMTNVEVDGSATESVGAGGSGGDGANGGSSHGNQRPSYGSDGSSNCNVIVGGHYPLRRYVRVPKAAAENGNVLTDPARAISGALTDGRLSLFPLRYSDDEVEDYFRVSRMRQCAARWAPIAGVHATGCVLLAAAAVSAFWASGASAGLLAAPPVVVAAVIACLAIKARRHNLLSLSYLIGVATSGKGGPLPATGGRALPPKMKKTTRYERLEETAPLWLTLLMMVHLELQGQERQVWVRVGRAYAISSVFVSAALSASRVAATFVQWVGIGSVGAWALLCRGEAVTLLTALTGFVIKYVVEFQARAERLHASGCFLRRMERPSARTKKQLLSNMLNELRSWICGASDSAEIGVRFAELERLFHGGHPRYSGPSASLLAEESLPTDDAAKPEKEHNPDMEGALQSADSSKLPPSSSASTPQQRTTSEEHLTQVRTASLRREQRVAQRLAETPLNEPELNYGVRWAAEHPAFVKGLGREMNLDLLQLYEVPIRCPNGVFGPHMLRDHAKAAGVDIGMLTKFLFRLDQNYLGHPYHNSTHGFAVGHQAMVLLQNLQLDPLNNSHVVSWGALDVLVFTVACFGHDAGHPARTSKFVTDFADPLSVIFPDSPLEHMHAAILLAGFEDPATNFLQGVVGSSAKLSQLRQRITQCILATDMTQNDKYVNRFKLLMPDMDPMRSTRDVWQLAAMLIKLADIGHVILPRDQHIGWSNRVVEEMYQQRTEEDAYTATPTIPYFKREIHSTNFPRTQMGFLHMLARPVALSLLNAFPDNTFFQAYLQQFRDHIQLWQDECDLLNGRQAPRQQYDLPQFDCDTGLRRNRAAEPLLAELARLARTQKLLGRPSLDFPLAFLQELRQIKPLEVMEPEEEEELPAETTPAETTPAETTPMQPLAAAEGGEDHQQHSRSTDLSEASSFNSSKEGQNGGVPPSRREEASTATGLASSAAFSVAGQHPPKGQPDSVAGRVPREDNGGALSASLPPQAERNGENSDANGSAGHSV